MIVKGLSTKAIQIFSILVLMILVATLLPACKDDFTISSGSKTTTSGTTTSKATSTKSTGTLANTTSNIVSGKLGEEHSVTLNNEVTVIIPANTFSAETKIEINSVEQPTAHEFDGFLPINQYEITSSSGGELGGEVEIEFAYDPSLLNEELEISQQLAVAYYDEEYGAWQEVDFTVDESRSVLAIKTSHFSLWSLFGFDSKWVTSTLPGFTIYFNKDVDAPPIGSIVSGEPIYEYASIVRTGLFDASKAYRELGFKMPEHTKVYIDKWGSDKEAEWGWFSKNIEIPITYIDEQELLKTAAHELFHAVQNQYVTFATMAANRWFMEATADYAAAHIATSYGLSDKLPYNYLRTGLASSSTFHMYQSAHFIKFLVDKGFSFKELFVSVMEGSGNALENLNKYLISNGSSLPEMYENFAYDVIFTNRINTPAPDPDVYNGIASPRSEFNLIESGKNELIKVSGGYTTALYGVFLKGNPNLTYDISVSAIEPTSGVKVLYVLAEGPGKLDVTQGGVLSHIPEEITVSGDSYIYFLVTNIAPSDGYVTVVIGKKMVTSHSNERSSVLVYNKEFEIDVSLSISASQPFSISEAEGITGEILYVYMYFEEIDKNIVIDAEVLVGDPIPVHGERPGYEYAIKKKYWGYDGEMETSTQLILSPDKPNASLDYGIIIGLFDKELGKFTTQEHGATLVVIKISTARQ
ncbi:MAG: hypothetical protein WC958_02195 [Dehalococcoidales bacterium]